MRNALFAGASASLALLTLLTAAPARADTLLTYDFNTQVSFADGAAAKGSFVFDASTDALLSWSVRVTAGKAGTQTIPAQTYSSSLKGDTVSYPSADHTLGFDLLGPAGTRNDLEVVFANTGLAGAPTEAYLGSASFDQVSLNSHSYANSQLATTGLAEVTLVSSVPEPSEWMMLLAGSLVIGSSVWRRSRQ